MPSYPVSIRRCHYIKVNGTQFGSPALREEKYCYFHAICHREGRMAAGRTGDGDAADAGGRQLIQLGLAGVIRQLVHRDIDPKTAALLLYALQTASANLEHTSFEPEPTMVVIDRECVERRPIGATAWSTVEGHEYDEIAKDDAQKDHVQKDKDDVRKKDGEREADLKRMIAGVTLDSGFLDKRAGGRDGSEN